MPHFTRRAQGPSVASSRKELENALKLSQAAVSIALEGLHRAEMALQSLSEIRVYTGALAIKAENGSGHGMSADHKRELASWIIKSLHASDEHASDIIDAWQGWSSAMRGCVRAKRCQMVMTARMISAMFETMFQCQTKRRKIADGMSAVEHEEHIALAELRQAAYEILETLREVHRRLRGHEKAWDWMEKELKKGFMAARLAISRSDPDKRWTV